MYVTTCYFPGKLNRAAMVEPDIDTSDIPYLGRAALYRCEFVPIGLRQDSCGDFTSKGVHVGASGLILFCLNGRAPMVALLN